MLTDGKFIEIALQFDESFDREKTANNKGQVL